MCDMFAMQSHPAFAVSRFDLIRRKFPVCPRVSIDVRRINKDGRPPADVLPITIVRAARNAFVHCAEQSISSVPGFSVTRKAPPERMG
jgi:hypothetical protein